jgi:hypothetical protein
MKDSIDNLMDSYVEKLGNLKNTEANLDLINEEFKTKFTEKSNELKEYLANNKGNVINEDVKDQVFMGAITIWNDIITLIKEGECNVKLTGYEIKTLINKLTQSVDYSSESVFYGIHIKSNFINKLPNKVSDNVYYDINLSFSHATLVHHLLSTIIVKGLNKETYAYAHILHTLSEITKVFTHYDILSKHLNNDISVWNMGLSGDVEVEEVEETESK